MYAGTIVFTIIGRPIRLPSLRPVLPPQPTAPPTVAAASRPMLFDAVQGKSVLILAFLRVCHRGGHGGTYHDYVILAMSSLGLRYWTCGTQ
jgi:hypothetical protein